MLRNPNLCPTSAFSGLSSIHQQKLFWFLFNIYKKDFGKALKQYIRSQQDKPKTLIFTCAKRRVDIKITKLKRNMWDWFYGTFYGK